MGGRSHIVDILEPTTKDCETLRHKGEFVLDARLLERILMVPILIVKIIPLSCRPTFSQALKKYYV